jgi:hypothetical protein
MNFKEIFNSLLLDLHLKIKDTKIIAKKDSTGINISVTPEKEATE